MEEEQQYAIDMNKIRNRLFDFGLENFGNTCYCNSVLQALYFCKPFRHAILEYHESLPKDHDESLLTALGDLFSSISNQKKRKIGRASCRERV